MPQPVDSLRELPTCKCDLCGDPMKFIGEHSMREAEVRVFRCYECCLVTTETFDPATRAWAKPEPRKR
jgi:hypothetical protein